MIGIILRALAFIALYIALMAYVLGLMWLGSAVFQPMWGMIPAMIVAFGGGLVLPIAIFFGVMTRD